MNTQVKTSADNMRLKDVITLLKEHRDKNIQIKGPHGERYALKRLELVDEKEYPIV